MPSDPYYKQTICFSLNKQDYSFNVSQELFSSHAVDNGTQRLLRTFLQPAISPPKKILDLGCGYGPIGIVLGKQYPQAEVHFVDRDALALEYAKQNVVLNHVQNPTFFYASLGFDNVKDKDFDLIVSNIPAKVGERVLKHFLADAQHHLANNGLVAIVVVEEINALVHRLLTENENIRIWLNKSWSGHHVYHYKFLSAVETSSHSAFESGKYDRMLQFFPWNKHNFQLNTTHHLREFDQLRFDTKLLLDNLAKIPPTQPSVMIIYPGQGHIPLAVAEKLNPQKISLVDRDLQALKTSKKNLVEAEFSAESIRLHHQIDWEVEMESISALIGLIPEKQNPQVYEMFLKQARELLSKKGVMLICSSSTTLFRIEDINKQLKLFKVIAREKNKGMSCVLFGKRS